MADNKVLPKRSEVKEEFTWNLKDLYESDALWEEKYGEAEELLKEFAPFKGRALESADTLYELLKLQSNISCVVERLSVYANRKQHQDTREAKYQAMADKARSLYVKLSGAVSFIEPEILEGSEELLESYMQSENGIEEFSQYLHNMVRQKSHTLSDEMEAILSKTGEFSYSAEDIYSMFNNADIKFPSILDENGEETAITHARFLVMQKSSDRRVRRESFEKFYRSYQDMENTLAAMYQANAKKDAFYADVRHYDSARAASLDNSNIPLSVYDNLIKAVHQGLPAFYRYVKLRKKLLGVDELHMYDAYVSLVSDVDKKISFEEAKQIVKEGLMPMGAEYIEKLEMGFQNRWIDIYENQGKRTGAYSSSAYGCHPYILLNYDNTLKSVFTLAHEMGHALHAYYSDEKQNYVNSAYRLFVAEVASTCNESLLIQHLLAKTEDRQEKAYLINYFLEQVKGTIFRQTMFAEFEMITHEKLEKGENLSAEELKTVYRDLNKLYFGPDMTIDEEIDMEWARIPHFYTSFYVYQYATGLSAAIALSRRILTLGEEGVGDYMSFLTGGCSKYPIDLLKDAGVDMTTAKPVEEALKLFEEMVDELERLTSEID